MKLLQKSKGNIFLLETPVEEQNQSTSKENPNITYSLGLSYIDAVLKKQEYNVKTKDYADWDEKKALEDIKKIIKKFKPKIVGFHVMTMTRATTYKAIKEIKKIDNSLKIVLGGIHSSVMYEQLLLNFPIDAVVIGEGEETIVDLSNALIKDKSIKNIKGIAFKEKSKVIKTPNRKLIKEIDDINFPNHGAFMNPKRTKINILSTRGCPFKCTFCCLHIISKRKYRMRSPLNVVNEIEYIAKKYPQIKEIEFSDDTLTLNEEEIINFCKEVIKRNLNKRFKFSCSARIKPASERMFKAMANANFVEIRFGIESGSKKILKDIKKGITKEEIIKTFKICSKFKNRIKFVKFLMVGFPGENWNTVKETVNFVKKLHKYVPMDFFQATILWVYPGTEVYKLMKKQGKIDDNFWLTDKPAPKYIVEHSEEELIKMSQYISFKSALDRGLLFIIKLILNKIKNNPRYEIKRIINKLKTLV